MLINISNQNKKVNSKCFIDTKRVKFGTTIYHNLLGFGNIVEANKETLAATGNYSVGMYGKGNKEAVMKNISGYTDTVIFDFDDGITYDALVNEVVKEFNLKAIIISTSSHMQFGKGERYRLLIQLDKMIGDTITEPKVYGSMIKKIGGHLNILLDADIGASNGNGRFNRSPDEPDVYVEFDGEPLCIDEFLIEAIQENEVKKKNKKKIREKLKTVSDGEIGGDIAVELADGDMAMMSELAEDDSCICPGCQTKPHTAVMFFDDETDLPVITCRRNNCDFTHKMYRVPKLFHPEFYDETKAGINSIDRIDCKDEQLMYTGKIDIVKAQTVMKTDWLMKGYGAYSDAMGKAHQIIGSTMNRVINENTSNLFNRKHLLPIYTGVGKTVALSYMTADYILKNPVDGVGALIITKFIDEAIALKENLIGCGVPEEWIMDYHSRNESKGRPQDLKYYPIVIITHNSFERRVVGELGWFTMKELMSREDDSGFEPIVFDRELLVIDEALSMIKEKTITTNQISFMANYLEAIQEEIEEIPEIDYFLKVVAPEFKSMAKVVRTMAVESGENTVAMNITSDMLGGDFGSPDGLEFKDIKKFLKEDKDVSLLSILTTAGRYSRVRGTQKAEAEKEIRDVLYKGLSSLETVLEKTDWATFKDSDVELWSYEDIFPKDKSYCVLDATSSIDYTLQLEEAVYGSDTNTRLVKGFDDLRTYSNFTLHYVRTKTGAASLIDDKDRLNKLLAYGLKLREGNEPTLIASFKKVSPHIESLTTDDKSITVEHYGNLRGKNNWRDRTFGVFLGLFQKPDYFYKNRIGLTIGSQDMIQATDAIHKYKQMDVLQDLIQDINRIAVRVIVDTKGNCQPSSAFYLISKGMAGDMQLDILRYMMPGINLVEHTEREVGLQIKIGNKGKNKEKFLSTCEDLIPTTSKDKSLATVLHEANITKEQWKDVIKQPNFYEWLKLGGYMIDGGSRKRVVFKVGKAN